MEGGPIRFKRVGINALRLLDSEQLEYAFQMHGINRDTQARRFYADVWDLIQSAEKIRDPVELGACQKKLRRLCNSYFHQMMEWRQEEEERYESDPACAAARENAREAAAMLPTFERQFFRYTLCYLELNRALIQMRAQLSHLARDINIDHTDIMEVNHGTGTLLFRAHAERMEIMEKRLRMDRVRSLLQQFDPLMEMMGDELPTVLGNEEGSHQLTLFKGAVRKSRFAQARQIIKGWKQKRLEVFASKVVDLAQKHEEELKAHDGLVLHSGELSLISAFLKGDEARANQFLEKFNLPYMVFQYKNLIHQGYILGRVGSLEGLIILHAKLLSIAARPHTDPALAQSQEQSVLVPARAQLQTRFKTLGAIFNEMETTISVLEKLIAMTRDYNAHTPAQ